MAVSDDRKFTKQYVHTLLEGVKGKALGEVDISYQFARTEKSEKNTGIAGDVIEQSVFIGICTISNRNSFPIFPTRKTNHTASLLYGQTYPFQGYKQTNVLISRHYRKVTSYTRVHCPGRSLTLRASAPL